ncbi:MAG: hypothetical protein MUC42_03625 [Bryobacter sp.]|jgi:hypothetical protein|nr:hypothetical protein [Bryobacter sp.]
MTGLFLLERGLHWLSVAGTMALVGVLLFRRLYPVYPCFLAYCLGGVVFTLGSALISFRSKAYLYWWLVATNLDGFLLALATIELVRRVLAPLPGLATLARWAMFGALLLAVVIGFSSLGPDFAASSARQNAMILTMITQRGVLTVLLVFLVFMLTFLGWYPVRLGRVVVRHAIIFAAYFFGKAAALFYASVSGHTTPRLLISLVLLLLTNACLAAWIVVLRPEAPVPQAGIAADAQTESLLLRKLSGLSDFVKRSSEK